MEEIFRFISREEYDREAKQLKSGESKIIYEKDKRKIKIIKQGRSIYNIIVNYGNTPIEQVAKKLLVQA